jgi:DNA invertase Pin-like site-specific DNA recombinase
MNSAAIYCRRSTDQDVAAEAKSVRRQEENARVFAAKRGWTVDDAHVFVDDGVSGSEFEKRLGLQRLMKRAEPRAPFANLIVSEQKSLGREMTETQHLIKRLALAGVEVHEYVHGKSLTPRTATDKMLSVVQSYADEDHRVKTAERMHEAHIRLAKKGHVTGGRVYGYRNRPVYSGVDGQGNPLKSHVERQIDEVEADIVRRIFKDYAEGRGLKWIAKRLTEERAPQPKYSTPKDGAAPSAGWAPATVAAILQRELYRGVIVWNKVKKRNATWGRIDWTPKPEAEWVRTPAEHLRIVSEDLWRQVQARRSEVATKALRFSSGRLSGRPPKHEIKNLLAGMASCSLCGGGLVVESSGDKRREFRLAPDGKTKVAVPVRLRKDGTPVQYRTRLRDSFGATDLPRPGEDTPEAPRRLYYYMCSTYRRKGNCTNQHRVPVDLLNEEVLKAVEEHVLTPEAVESVIRLAERDEVAEQRDRLEKEAKDTTRRINALLAAIEDGGDAKSLVTRIRDLETRKAAIGKDLAGLRPIKRPPAAVVTTRLDEWRRLLRSSITQGRGVLQRAIAGRIACVPREDGGFDFRAQTRFDKLFSGVAAPIPRFMANETGVGLDGLTANDTLEGDFERLLERVQTAASEIPERVATPAGFEPALPA